MPRVEWIQQPPDGYEEIGAVAYAMSRRFAPSVALATERARVPDVIMHNAVGHFLRKSPRAVDPTARALYTVGKVENVGDDWLMTLHVWAKVSKAAP